MQGWLVFRWTFRFPFLHPAVVESVLCPWVLVGRLIASRSGEGLGRSAVVWERCALFPSSCRSCSLCQGVEAVPKSLLSGEAIGDPRFFSKLLLVRILERGQIWFDVNLWRHYLPRVEDGMVELFWWTCLGTGSRPILYTLFLVFINVWLGMCMSLDSNSIGGYLSDIL